MKIFNDSVYFTVSTANDLREHYNITYACITKVLNFFETIADEELMFIFDDDKGHKTKRITEKNKQEFLNKLTSGKIFSFGIMEYMKSKDYFYNFDNITRYPNLFCSIELGNPNKWGRDKPTFDGIDVSVPTEFLIDKKYFNNFFELFKEMHFMMRGINSFISRGTYIPTLRIMNGAPFIRTYYTINKNWDKFICGYFWGNVLSENHLRIVGDYEHIKEQGFYKVEKWGETVYIQLSEKILDYDISDAIKIRKFLLPIFPPKEEKQFSIYSSIDNLKKAQEIGTENFMIEEDLI